MRAVDHQLDMQPVMAQQHRVRRARLAAEAHELPGIAQPRPRSLQRHDQAPVLDRIPFRLGMAAALQRRRLVEEFPRAGDHPRAAQLVESRPAPGPAVIGNGVRSVQRVIQAAPARIRGIQRIPCVGHRHHELRAGDAGDLGIDIGRADNPVRRFVLEIADLAQERLVRVGVDRSAAILAMPGVDPRLHRVAPIEQRAIARRQLADQRTEPLPEALRLDPGAGDRLVVDEVMENLCNPQATRFDPIHAASPLPPRRRERPFCRSPRPPATGDAVVHRS